MSEFTKFDEMRSEGASAAQVYAAAEADGLDAIKRIRLVRQVFGLTLLEAKKVTDANDVWSQKQAVAPGSTVYWEGWSTEDGFYLMQAEVTDIDGDLASLQNHKKFLVTNNGLEEVKKKEPRAGSLRVSYLQKSLTDRIERLLEFVDDLAHPGRDENEKKVV